MYTPSEVLKTYIMGFAQYADDWTKEKITIFANGLCIDVLKAKKKDILPIVQIALCGSTQSVDIYTMIYALGQEESVLRFADMLNRIDSGEFNAKESS